MPSLSISPASPVSLSTITVTGTGFAVDKTRLLLAGAVVSAVFRPASNGTFSMPVTLGSQTGVKTLSAQRQVQSTWSTVATLSITISTGTPIDPYPTISGIASSVTTTSATITWTTSEPTTARVEFGTTTAYGTLSAEVTTLTTSHSQALGTVSLLSPGTLYHFRCRSKDSAGQETISSDQTFTTQTSSLVISGVTISNLTQTGVTIAWSVSAPATGQIKYGLTTAYGTLSTKENSLYTHHTQILTGLTSATTYHFSVMSTDATGRSATSPDATFMTMGVVVAPTNLQTAINNTPNGSTLDATGGVYTGAFTIAHPMTLKGGTINSLAGATGLAISASSVIVDGLTILGPQATVYDASAFGITIGAYSGVTIRNANISRLGREAVRAVGASNLLIENSTITDIVYAGIMILGCATGRIAGNTVQRIGVVGAAANSNNAYGIVTSQTGPDGAFTSPPTSDYVVDSNLVEDVPTWHGLNTHSGVRCTWTNNTIRRCHAAIFVTGFSDRRAYDNDVNGNTCVAINGTTYYGIVSVFSTNGYVRNNTISGWPTDHGILTSSGSDPASVAVNLSISGNTIT